MKRNLIAVGSVIGISAWALVGCESKAGNGALIGAGAGALAGGIIGNQSHHAAGGAAIGAGAGALGGYLIGNEMDKSDAKKQRDHSDY